MSDMPFTSWHPRPISIEMEGSQPSPEEIRQQAQEKGYSEGYTRGLADGEEASKHESERLVSQLQSLLTSLDRPLATSEAKICEYLLSIIGTICRTLLRRELSTDDDLILSTLNDALKLLAGDRGLVTVSMHPDDASIVRPYWKEAFGELNVIEDDNIIRGGCKVARRDSLVNATIETQLKNLLEDFSRLNRPDGASSEAFVSLDSGSIDSHMSRLNEE